MSRKKMAIVFVILFFIIGAIVIWFNVPFSPVKKQFKNDVVNLTKTNVLKKTAQEIFIEDDFLHLPVVIQKYIKKSGYIGKPKMSYLKMVYRDVAFMQGKIGPLLKIDYTQYNFVAEPCRMAFINSAIFGIPFEGYDYYSNGIGGMKGVIAKFITLFDQRGSDMDKASLATFLAECLFVPSTLLQDNIRFESIDDFSVKATINYKEQTASGIFTFNNGYEMISFTTTDRAVSNPDGTMEYIPWTAACSDYVLSENGIKLPTKFKAIWNYPEKDFVYFDGDISRVSYND